MFISSMNLIKRRNHIVNGKCPIVNSVICACFIYTKLVLIKIIVILT